MRAGCQVKKKRIEKVGAGWRKKGPRVDFLSFRFTLENLEILRNIAQNNPAHVVNIRFLPNVYKTNPKQPDFFGSVDIFVQE